MKILNANDPDFVQQFRDALGLRPGEAVEFVTPQFERTDGIAPVSSMDCFGALRSADAQTLKELGCGQWDKPDENGRALMLFPREWYGLIPDGYEIEDIMGEVEPFRRGVMDDDYRFGCLAYGVRLMVKP